MAFYQFRVGSYARSIYLDGAKTFDQAALESPDFDQAIKEYAAKGFTYAQIDNALTKGYINQEQYEATIALKMAIEPRPLASAEPTA